MLPAIHELSPLCHGTLNNSRVVPCNGTLITRQLPPLCHSITRELCPLHQRSSITDKSPCLMVHPRNHELSPLYQDTPTLLSIKICQKCTSYLPCIKVQENELSPLHQGTPTMPELSPMATLMN